MTDGEYERYAVMTREQALEALWLDWDEAYEIDVVGDEWRARRHDGIGGWMTASSPEDLRRLIWEDHAFKPVPRVSQGDAGGVVLGTDPGSLVGDGGQR